MSANENEKITVEERYKQQELRENVLARPAVYIGSIQESKQTLWVVHPIATSEIETARTRRNSNPHSGGSPAPSSLSMVEQSEQESSFHCVDSNLPIGDDDGNGKKTPRHTPSVVGHKKTSGEKALSFMLERYRFVEEEVKFIPAFLKVFDEILVNALDVRQVVANKMTQLKVDIDPKSQRIKVWNNGKTLPVVIHKEKKMYVAEMVFGEMLTSSWYDDTKERTVGGQNGMGSKLTNIWSKFFRVTCNDTYAKKQLTVTWHTNMTSKTIPKITTSKGASDWTEVEFQPDYTRFNMPNGLTDDMLKLLYRRTLDAVGIAYNLQVTFNGVKLPRLTWKQYCQLYLESATCPLFHSSPLAISKTNNNANQAEENVNLVESHQHQQLSTLPTMPIGWSSKSLIVYEEQTHGEQKKVEGKERKGTPKQTAKETPNSTADKQKPSKAVLNTEPQQQQPVQQPEEHVQVRPRWEIGVALAPRGSGFKHVSFVNGISTLEGGTHVIYVTEIIVKMVMDYFQSLPAAKRRDIKPAMIRNNLFVFVNAIVPNPDFSSQTKVKLVSGRSKLSCSLSNCEKFKKQLLAPTAGILQRIEQAWAEQEERSLAKMEHKLVGGTTNTTRHVSLRIPKLEDANKAGVKGHSTRCTLILTEGDSAKGLAMNGVTEKGRDYFGVFPLKGKPKNVKECTLLQLMKNVEFVAITKIIGLRYNTDYTHDDSFATLRYGRILIFTDADTDGTHIAALILNWFVTFWPSLYKRKGFLSLFITPIIKATKANHAPLSFYSLPEYEAWKKSQTQPSLSSVEKSSRQKKSSHGGWKIKYFKGLGTSTPADGKEYFKNLEQHQIDFTWCNKEDDQVMDLAFAKKRKMADARKEWLSQYSQKHLRQKGLRSIRYADFINQELILFSLASNTRAIPSVVDGLKPAQRKILYGCFKRDLTKEVKVAQLAGYISEHAAYHHGEDSLCGTIVSLAQDYIGTNNINYLLPNGQFGNRLSGLEAAASPRYIFTALHPLTRLLFHPHDDPLLHYQLDDGQKVEPKWYVPILPTALLNGNRGMGTGWSTFVPPYNPKDLVQAIQDRLRIDNDNNLAGSPGSSSSSILHPWYKDFKGEIKPLYTNKKFTKQYSLSNNTATNNDQTHNGPLPTTTSASSASSLLVPPSNFSSRLYPDGYQISGKITREGKQCVRITELPIETWTETYREKTLNKLLAEGHIKRFTEHHGDNTVDFLIELKEEKINELEAQEAKERLELSSFTAPLTQCSNKITTPAISGALSSSSSSSLCASSSSSSASSSSSLSGSSLNKKEDQGEVQPFKKKQGVGLAGFFDLQTTISLRNMVLFDPWGRLRTYYHVNEIIDEFFAIRLVYYDKRKLYLLSGLKERLLVVSNKLKFVLAKLPLRETPKRVLVSKMVEMEFSSKQDLENLSKSHRRQLANIRILPPPSKPHAQQQLLTSVNPTESEEVLENDDNDVSDTDENDEEDDTYENKGEAASQLSKLIGIKNKKNDRDNNDDDDDEVIEDVSGKTLTHHPAGENTHASSGANFDYLLTMPICSLTMERVARLTREKQQIEAEIKVLEALTAKSMWLRDLDEFNRQYDAHLEREVQKQKAADRDTKTKKRVLSSTRAKRTRKPREPSASLVNPKRKSSTKKPAPTTSVVSSSLPNVGKKRKLTAEKPLIISKGPTTIFKKQKL